MPTVLVYQVVGTIPDPSDPGRNYERVQIIRIRPDHAPEALADLGGRVGDYLEEYALSPDKRHLALDMRSSILILDLNTEERWTVTEAREPNFHHFLFSHDSSKLLVWSNTDTLEAYQVTLYDLATRKPVLQRRGIAPKIGHGEAAVRYSPIPVAWRSDDVVVVVRGYTEYQQVRLYDLNSGRLISLPENTDLQLGRISEWGSYVAQETCTLKDPCPGLNSCDQGHIPIVDTVTLRLVDQVGNDTEVVWVREFSPDERQVLYSATPPYSGPGEDADPRVLERACDEYGTRKPRSYTKVVGGGAPIPADEVAIRREWNKPEQARIDGMTGPNHFGSRLSIGGKDVVALSGRGSMKLIAEFYE